MAESSPPSSSVDPVAAVPSPAGSIAKPANLRAAWPIPVLVVASGLLVSGIVTAFMTRPHPNVSAMLESAQHALASEDHEAALKYLNDKIAPYFNAGQMTKTQTTEFHLLRARGVAMGARQLHVDSPENAQIVMDELLAAQETGGELDPSDQLLLADAFVTLEKPERAKEIAERLPESEHRGRSQIIKRIVEHGLEHAKSDATPALRLLAEFLASRDPTPDDRAWAVACQGELLIQSGMAEGAVNKLLQSMPGIIPTVGVEQAANLRRVLGKAYLSMGMYSEASRELEGASRQFLESDPRWGATQAMLGRIDELTGDANRARKRYQEAIDRAGDEEGRQAPMLGLAEVLATLGEFDDSAKVYAELLSRIRTGKHAEGVTTAAVTKSLMERYKTRFGAGDMPSALRYAQLAVDASGTENAPSEAILALASVQRRVADALLAPTQTGADRLVQLDRLDPATREQARLALVNAGAAYKRHAVSLGALDGDAYADSLWKAADCYDLAGDQDQAIPLLNEFIRFFMGDKRWPEARFRLGQAYQSRGDYATAADQFRALLPLPGAEEATSRGASAYADRAILPLAQCLLLDGEPANDEEAEHLLLSIVTGRVGSGSGAGRDFRDALVELAGIRQRRGDWAGAIQNLEEATQRFPDMPGAEAVRYSLAESYRKDAGAMLRTLREAMPDQQRQLLLRTRQERLARAMDLYQQTIASLGARDPRTLSKLDRLQLRNAYFNIGECAFAQRDFEEAIRRYEAAREKYSGDPASLVALVQIVNCYVEMGDRDRAAAANARARRFYDSLPEASWSDPDLPMGREEWQRWLDSMQYLGVAGSEAKTGQATAPESKEAAR